MDNKLRNSEHWNAFCHAEKSIKMEIKSNDVFSIHLFALSKLKISEMMMKMKSQSNNGSKRKMWRWRRPICHGIKDTTIFGFL